MEHLLKTYYNYVRLIFLMVTWIWYTKHLCKLKPNYFKSTLQLFISGWNIYAKKFRNKIEVCLLFSWYIHLKLAFGFVCFMPLKFSQCHTMVWSYFFWRVSFGVMIRCLTQVRSWSTKSSTILFVHETSMDNTLISMKQHELEHRLKNF